jgi:hypothetical protein
MAVEQDLALTFTEKAMAVAAVGAALVVGGAYAAAEKVASTLTGRKVEITHRGFGF